MLHSVVITPGCRSTCQRRSPLNSRSTGPSINGCTRRAANILNGRINARRQRRKSSITAIFFFVLPSFSLSELTFVAALTRLHRPASAQHFLLGLILIYQWRDGISGFDLPPLIGATHPATRSPARNSARARNGERVRMDGSPRNCGCCARDAVGCCCLRTVATPNGGCGCVDGATLNHLRSSWENVPHVTFNAQVRRSSTACDSNDSTQTSNDFEQHHFEC